MLTFVANRDLSIKSNKVDFLTWAETHRVFDTFFAPHLSQVDLCVLRICCKTLNRLNPRKIIEPSVDEKITTMNLAVKYGHYKLALWMYQKEFKFILSDEADSNHLFRPFSEEKKEHERLLDKLVMCSFETMVQYCPQFAYWGNIDVLKKLIRENKHVKQEESILEYAMVGGHPAVLDLPELFQHVTDDIFSYSAAARCDHKNLLDWGLENLRYITPHDAKDLYYLAFTKENDAPFFLEKQQMLKKWFEENKLVVDHEKGSVFQKLINT